MSATALAVARASVLITHEAGPLNLFGRLRARVERRDTNGKKLPCLPGSLCDMLTCFHCVGLWLSLAAVVAYASAPKATLYCLSPLWLAGIVTAVHNRAFR